MVTSNIDTRVLEHFTQEQVLQCDDCGETFKREDAGPELYECGECGQTFNKDTGGGKGNRCQDCNRFAAKVEDFSCPHCEAGPSDGFTEVNSWTCDECDDEFDDEGPAIEHFKQEHFDELDAHTQQLLLIETPTLRNNDYTSVEATQQ